MLFFFLFRIFIIEIIKLCVVFFVCFTVILFESVSSKKWRRKRNHQNHADEIFYNSEYPDELSSKLIYCSEKTEKENYCVYTDKFHIARNKSFDCSDQYLGVIVKIPKHYENGTRTDKIEQVFCYLTTHSIGEYTFLESKQLKSISNCDAVKQLYIFFMSYIF